MRAIIGRQMLYGVGDFDRRQRVVAVRLALLGQSARLAHHSRRRAAGAAQGVVVADVQVAVQQRSTLSHVVDVGRRELGRYC